MDCAGWSRRFFPVMDRCRTADVHRYLQRAFVRGAFLIPIGRADEVENDLIQRFTRPSNNPR
jgi:hypothetical protein